MADIAIKIGVNAPANDVNGVMRIFDYIYQQPIDSDDYPFTFIVNDIMICTLIV